MTPHVAGVDDMALSQVWIVDFRGWMRFRKVTSVSKATHVKVRARQAGRGPQHTESACHRSRTTGVSY